MGKMIRMFDKPHKCASIFCKPRIGRNGDKIKGKSVTDKSVADLAKASLATPTLTLTRTPEP